MNKVFVKKSWLKVFFKDNKTRARIKPLAILQDFMLVCAGILLIAGIFNGFSLFYFKWILMALGVNLITSGLESYLLKDEREGIFASFGMGLISFCYSFIL
jgi:uncharacterized membrane protein SirB2